MRLRTTVLVAAALCAGIACPARAQILFLGEFIDFALTDSAFRVNAVYRFANADGPTARHLMSYPFPDSVNEISDICVTDLRSGAGIACVAAGMAISFSITLAETDTADILVTYRQPAKHRNVYILRSTQRWDRALEFARYTLRVDRCVPVAAFSYAPDLREETADGFVYHWSKTNFMPDEDFIVTVGERESSRSPSRPPR